MASVFVPETPLAPPLTPQPPHGIIIYILRKSTTFWKRRDFPTRAATDIGGTFTDLVAIDEHGALVLEKAHTTPPNFERGVMEVLKKSGINLRSLTDFFHGTTTIINALTEHKGAKTALLTTSGTTAKCSLIDAGEVKVTTSYYIERDERNAGYPIMVPVVDIVEIGNGGGSIAWIDEAGSLKVGPKSAGALPGPVAYGKGGTEPTTTDANLIAGRLSAKNFDMDVDLDAVRRALADRVGAQFGQDAEGAAESILRVADSNMNNALKLISVRRGYDPRDFAMVAFGGGGPIHGPSLARELNIGKVIVPVAASVFSAWGMLMTDIRHDFIQTKITSFSVAPVAELNAMWDAMTKEAIARFAGEGVSPDRAVFTYIADMRYMGQEHTVQVVTPAVPWKEEDKADIMARFHATHEHFYTFRLPDTPAEIVNLHLVAYGRLEKPALQKIAPQEGGIETALKERRRVFFAGDGWLEAPIYDRARLGAGASAVGPLVVEEPTTATVVCPGQTLQVDQYGNLIIETEAK